MFLIWRILLIWEVNLFLSEFSRTRVRLSSRKSFLTCWSLSTILCIELRWLFCLPGKGPSMKVPFMLAESGYGFNWLSWESISAFVIVNPSGLLWSLVWLLSEVVGSSVSVPVPPGDSCWVCLMWPLCTYYVAYCYSDCRPWVNSCWSIESLWMFVLPVIWAFPNLLLIWT